MIVCLIWPSGTLPKMAKIAYKWLTRARSTHGATAVNGTWVWSLQLLENIKHYLWLLDHKSILTNLFRLRRHICFDCSCCRCGDPEESILPLLLVIIVRWFKPTRNNFLPSCYWIINFHFRPESWSLSGPNWVKLLICIKLHFSTINKSSHYNWVEKYWKSLVNSVLRTLVKELISNNIYYVNYWRA